MTEKILQVQGLKTYFNVSGAWFSHKKQVKAVDDVSFDIYKGETLGLVGESGCGKSTLGRTITKVYTPTDGKILFRGKDVFSQSRKEEESYRKSLQMVFQDPFASLDPRMTVGEIIKEPMIIHHVYNSAREQNEQTAKLMELVGLKPDHARRYPHEFSGGQRQRIGIARTLALNPEFIICDEPTSALDVSIQAQILSLLKRIQKEMGLSYLFISHDLGLVRYISDRIGIMYLGHLVECGESNEVCTNPQHPYTQALLSAVPVPDPRAAKEKKRIILQGEIPSPINPPSGCPFSPRCRYATETCKKEIPKLRNVQNRQIACHNK